MNPEAMRRGLEKALNRAGEGDTISDLEQALAEGRALLWTGERAALVTTGSGQDYHVWLGCGDLKELISLTPGVCAHARALGCKTLTINGRPGWARVLEKLGFTRHGDELRKML